jgi:hypothetical protein
MPFESTIASFAGALLDPSRPAPAATQRRDGRPVDRRFAVYRNNVAAALIGALEARYPVVRRLVGDDFFRGMAGAFVAGEKPRSPALMLYGEAFPDFVARFPPAGAIPFLADVARLESAWVEAYHAAEAETLGLNALTSIAPGVLETLRLRPHPAARLLRSAYPAASIWAAAQSADERRRPEVWAAEEALVTRPDADVFVRVLPPGGFAFAAALFSGASLGEAATIAIADDFDPGAHLIGLIEAGAFQSVISKEFPHDCR